LVGGIRGVKGVLLCQKRLKLSLEVDECKPLPASTYPTVDGSPTIHAASAPTAAATNQGLTLVHSSAQLKRLLCDRGCS